MGPRWLVWIFFPSSCMFLGRICSEDFRLHKVRMYGKLRRKVERHGTLFYFNYKTINHFLMGFWSFLPSFWDTALIWKGWRSWLAWSVRCFFEVTVNLNSFGCFTCRIQRCCFFQQKSQEIFPQPEAVEKMHRVWTTKAASHLSVAVGNFHFLQLRRSRLRPWHGEICSGWFATTQSQQHGGV